MQDQQKVQNGLVVKLTLLLAVAVTGLGLISLIGWISSMPLLSTFRSGFIPMAPSTALLFGLFGIALLLKVLSGDTSR